MYRTKNVVDALCLKEDKGCLFREFCWLPQTHAIDRTCAGCELTVLFLI